MSADTLLNRLERVQRRGDGRWVARCPAHKDRGPSLSVRELADGTVLVHCFAGCSMESIVGAVGLDVMTLFPPKPAGAGAGRSPERRPFSSRELLDALHRELSVAWVVLADVAAGRELVAADRRRAAVARDRCQALINELRHVH